MQRKYLSIIAAGALALATSACGDDSSDETETDADSTTTSGDSTDTEAPSGNGIVETATTDLGEVLVDGDGFTLYGFTPDEGGVPTCYDGCATSWPALRVESEELPEGLDPGLFSTVERDEGGFQIVAGDWPLYRFAGDEEAGDVNGQGVGEQWFAVSPEGELIEGDGGGAGAESDADSDTDDNSGGGYDY